MLLIPCYAEMTAFELLQAWTHVNLVYISMLGSAASYGVFFYNASRGNLTALSSLTFLTPMFAAGTGFLLLGRDPDAPAGLLRSHPLLGPEFYCS